MKYTTIITTIISFILGLIIAGMGSYYYYYNHYSTISPPIKETEGAPTSVSTTTAIKVTPKTDGNDLILDNTYTATIDSVTYKIPISTTTNTDTTAIVTTTTDLTPVIKEIVDKREKKWEVGTGIGVVNKSVYLPVSIQRNFGGDRAIELTVGIGKDKIGQAVYKWRF